jgi:hypothetical protein
MKMYSGGSRQARCDVHQSTMCQKFEVLSLTWLSWNRKESASVVGNASAPAWQTPEEHVAYVCHSEDKPGAPGGGRWRTVARAVGNHDTQFRAFRLRLEVWPAAPQPEPRAARNYRFLSRYSRYLFGVHPGRVGA